MFMSWSDKKVELKIMNLSVQLFDAKEQITSSVEPDRNINENTL